MLRWLPLSLLVLAPLAHADQVWLRDGRVLVGDTETHGETLIVATLNGEVRVPRDQVLRIRSEQDLRSELSGLIARCDAAPFARVELARTARDWGLYDRMWALLDDALPQAEGAAEARLHELLGELEPVLLAAKWRNASPAVKVRELLDRVDPHPARQAAVEEILAHLDGADEALRIRARAATDPAERAVAVRALARRDQEGNDRFVWRTAVLDRSPDVRAAAAEAIAPEQTGEAVRYLVAGLQDDAPAVRVRTAEAYARMGDPAAIDVLVDAGPNAGTPRRGSDIGGSTRANVAFITQQAYIRDFDVEVAQASFIANPIVDVLQSGTVLDVTVAAVVTYRTWIVGSWRKALQELAGSDPGNDPAKWAAWRASLDRSQR